MVCVYSPTTSWKCSKINSHYEKASGLSYNPYLKMLHCLLDCVISHKKSMSTLIFSPVFNIFLNMFLLVIQFSSVTQLCPTLCDPMNRSTPGLPVHHQLLEFTQTHVHRVSDASQPSHPLSSPSPPAPNPSQHQTLFQ